MKNLTLLSYLLIVTSLSNAQPVRIAAGGTIDKEYLDKISISQKNFIRQELEGRSRQNYFIDQKNKTLYMGIARDDDGQYRFGVLTNYTTLSDSRVMQLEMPGIGGMWYSLVKMDEINGHRFIFYITGKDEESALYVNEMDDKFVLLGSPIKLVERKKRFQSTSIHISEDKKSILIFESGVGDYEKSAFGALRENEFLSCTLLDEQFGVVWQTEYEMPFRTTKGDISRVAVDNARNMYIIAYDGNEKDMRADLFQYYWQLKEWKKTPLGKTNLKTWGCNLEIFGGTMPVIVGLYGTLRDSRYFITVVDAPGRIAREISNKSFPKDYELYDDPISTAHYRVSNLVMTDNNNVTFSVEGGVQLTNSMNEYRYIFSPTFVKQVDLAGRDVWQHVVHKSQVTDYIPNCGSHALIARGNDIVVLYADNADNMKRGPDEKKVKIYNREKNVVVTQTIDITGKISKELITVPEIDSTFGINPIVLIALEEDIYLTEFWETDGRAKWWSYRYATIDLR